MRGVLLVLVSVWTSGLVPLVLSQNMNLDLNLAEFFQKNGDKIDSGTSSLQNLKIAQGIAKVLYSPIGSLVPLAALVPVIPLMIGALKANSDIQQEELYQEQLAEELEAAATEQPDYQDDGDEVRQYHQGNQQYQYGSPHNSQYGNQQAHHEVKQYGNQYPSNGQYQVTQQYSGGQYRTAQQQAPSGQYQGTQQQSSNGLQYQGGKSVYPTSQYSSGHHQSSSGHPSTSSYQTPTPGQQQPGGYQPPAARKQDGHVSAPVKLSPPHPQAQTQPKLAQPVYVETRGNNNNLAFTKSVEQSVEKQAAASYNRYQKATVDSYNQHQKAPVDSYNQYQKTTVDSYKQYKKPTVTSNNQYEKSSPPQPVYKQSLVKKSTSSETKQAPVTSKPEAESLSVTSNWNPIEETNVENADFPSRSLGEQSKGSSRNANSQLIYKYVVDEAEEGAKQPTLKERNYTEVSLKPIFYENVVDVRSPESPEWKVDGETAHDGSATAVDRIGVSNSDSEEDSDILDLSETYDTKELNVDKYLNYKETVGVKREYM